MTAPLQFVKVEGAGNDYVLVDVFEQRVTDPARLSRAVSDRHRGVGADGLLLVGSSARGGDAAMRIFNADGSEGRMCGNGLRCVMRYLVEAGRAAGPRLAVDTASGARRGELLPDGRVRTTMGVPRFAAAEVPVRADPGREDPAEATVPPAPRAFCVSVGNPHAVVPVADADAADLARLGAALQASDRFPEGVNVHVVSTDADGALRARPFERGSGATRACATGAVAVAAVARRQGWTDADRVRVRMPGGELEVEWPGAGETTLTGPARLVFRGEWTEA